MIAKKAGLSRKTVYKAFHGTASDESVLKIKKSVYSLTGLQIPVKELLKGKYSDVGLIRSLSKSVERSLVKTFYVGYTDDVRSSCYDTDVSVSADFELQL